MINVPAGLPSIAEGPRHKRARGASADTGGAGDVATDADIVRTLRRKAAKGDVNAARELREWRDRESTHTQGDAWMEVLTSEQRETLRTWINEGVERAEGRSG